MDQWEKLLPIGIALPVRDTTGRYGNVTARLNEPVKRTPIDDEVLDHRKCGALATVRL